MFLNVNTTEVISAEEEILIEFAKELGMDGNDPEYYEMDEYEVLSEGLINKSRIIRGKKEKMAALTGSSALLIARERKDPLFAKLKMFAQKRKELKKKIAEKYNSKAVRMAKNVLKKSLKPVSKELPKNKTIDES